MIRVVADHEGPGQVPGNIQHHTFFFGGGQVVPGPLLLAAFVQIKNADDPALGDDLVLS